ncbi:MAG TPA: carboxypeptidase-like regulatory domain-containing protein [Patescibacteria group bacterium]|nr:carboxypeptidase-like regulatory domain-containing protein [Patescibacteria group bacterium]
MTRKLGTLDRSVALLLTLAISGYWVPASRAAIGQPQLAEIRGNVLAADGLTAVAGVSVKAANMQTRQVYTSQPTGQNGMYSLQNLPAGSYDLAVETSHGLYPADTLVDANAGKRLTVSLALKPVAKPGENAKDDPPAPPKPEEGTKDEGKKDEGKKEEGKKDQPASPPEPQPQKKPKKTGGFWRSPGGAAIVIVAGAAVVGFAANNAAGNSSEPPSLSPH